MGILMAIGAGGRQVGELLNRHFLLTRFEMTRTAGLAKMGAFQGITRFIMVKGYFNPPVAVMARDTTRFGIVFFIQAWPMDVFMAIVASHPDFPEAPSVSLFMAIEAGSCQVGSCQFKWTGIVLFNGEAGLFKSPDRMAFAAVG